MGLTSHYPDSWQFLWFKIPHCEMGCSYVLVLLESKRKGKQCCWYVNYHQDRQFLQWVQYIWSIYSPRMSIFLRWCRNYHGNRTHFIHLPSASFSYTSSCQVTRSIGGVLSSSDASRSSLKSEIQPKAIVFDPYHKWPCLVTAQGPVLPGTT